ncbi:hypothetical protein DMA11_11215 [Marinilabiliaceae bacterium JC017]|nr:hypothetical protein DMA11_11215 [Marinilabiliaceae bacterium JC017]
MDGLNSLPGTLLIHSAVGSSYSTNCKFALAGLPGDQEMRCGRWYDKTKKATLSGGFCIYVIYYLGHY